MNPYTNRVMIRNPEDFYNRKAEVRKIFSRIGASRPQSISVVGDRRIGKSSLLYYLCNEAVKKMYLENPEKYIFAFFDFQEKKNMSVTEFFHTVTEKIAEQLPEKTEDLLQDFSYDPFLKLIKTLVKYRNIIFVFDEFDAITNNENFNAEFFSFLRSIANSCNVAYVTSSKRDLQELCHANEIKDSPFFNIFTSIPLGSFDEESALELIRVPSQREGFPLEKYEKFILELAGYYPLFIQIACSTFFDMLLEGGQTCIDLNRIKERYYEEAEGHFRYIWYHFREDEKACLKNIAESKELDRKLSYTARKLAKRGVLVEGEGYYRISSSCFEEFIRNMQSI
jgi:AAA+ ATPase superfamily predicted ATPase